MNAYASYAAKAAPFGNTLANPRKEPSALDKKMWERQRLNKQYRAWKREEAQSALREEPRLVGFMRYLRTVGVEQADELIEAVASSWLVSSAQNVRIFALRMIDARCNWINKRLGFEILDDPIWPDTSTYFRAREILHRGGRA